MSTRINVFVSTPVPCRSIGPPYSGNAYRFFATYFPCLYEQKNDRLRRNNRSRAFRLRVRDSLVPAGALTPTQFIPPFCGMTFNNLKILFGRWCRPNLDFRGHSGKQSRKCCSAERISPSTLPEAAFPGQQPVGESWDRTVTLTLLLGLESAECRRHGPYASFLFAGVSMSPRILARQHAVRSVRHRRIRRRDRHLVRSGVTAVIATASPVVFQVVRIALGSTVPFLSRMRIGEGLPT